MKIEIKNKIPAELETTHLFDTLPTEICGYTLKFGNANIFKPARK